MYLIWPYVYIALLTMLNCIWDLSYCIGVNCCWYMKEFMSWNPPAEVIIGSASQSVCLLKESSRWSTYIISDLTFMLYAQLPVKSKKALYIAWNYTLNSCKQINTCLAPTKEETQQQHGDDSNYDITPLGLNTKPDQSCGWATDSRNKTFLCLLRGVKF